MPVCTVETAKIGSLARANTCNEERHIRLLSMRRSERKQRETRYQRDASTNDSELGAAQRPAIARDRTPGRHSYSSDHVRLMTKSASAFTGVLRVGDRLQPSHVLTAVGFLHGDMFHAMVGRRSVPMLFIRRNPNSVTRTNFAHWSTPRLNPAYPRGDKKRLTKRVVMPSSSRARFETNPCRPNTCRFWCLDDGILPDRPRE